MPELHLYQPGKIGKYSACGPFAKHTHKEFRNF